MEASQSRVASDVPVAATITVLLEEARRMQDEERLHGEGIDSRLGQLTGFAGIILTLIGPLGAEHLDDGNGAFFDLFYVGSVLLLAGSALLAVTVGLRTRTVQRVDGSEMRVPWRQRIGVENETLDRFGDSLAAEPTADIEKVLMETVVEKIKDQRDLNGRKSEVLRFVSFGIAISLLAVAAQALILAL